jgi:excisionase family DNA binding protein
LKSYYTTSEAASLLSVSADTVLKWVRAGKIRSYRTPGGHARIPAEAIAALLPAGAPAATTAVEEKPEVFRFCWDYYGGPDGMREDCRSCVAFKSQARRCYEMRAIPEEFGHLRLFCQTRCEDCTFYKLTHDQEWSVLVVSRNRTWLDSLAAEAAQSDLRLACATSEYECAVVVESFRPDFVVLDASFGKARMRDICRHLTEDDRIPFTRIILTSRQAKWAKDCKQDIFGWIEKPFSIERLQEFISGVGALAQRSSTAV